MKEKINLQAFPNKPGVYLMKDKGGRIIYIGKAGSLKGRVRSYFTKREDLSPRIRLLINKVADIEYLVTDSQIEALVLENNLIKKHHPYFNVRLRDDKTYPYIKITTFEDYPRLQIVRRMQADKAAYFGPYTNVSSMRETLSLISQTFPLRTCNKKINGKERRACLNYQIKRCLAPCVGGVSKDDYLQLVKNVCSFLAGKQEKVVKDLQAQMERASHNLEFEKAAQIRDKIQTIEKVIEKQKMVLPKVKDEDIIGISHNENSACLEVFFVRQGKLLGEEHFIMEHKKALKREILTTFVKQFYLRAARIPPRIVIPFEIEERESIEDWLSEKRGGKVFFKIPRQGEEKGLINLANKNANLHLTESLSQDKEERKKEVLDELQNLLNLKSSPLRIEAFDISNLGGKEAVGSLVVFLEGKPNKGDYRRFKIKTVEGANDYAMLGEVLSRRFQSPPFKPSSLMPDLLLIDGGKGQLNSCLLVLKRLGLSKIPAIGLAKKEEHIFIRDKDGSLSRLVLAKDSKVLHLLQNVRDEAHRFALSYHKKLRKKKLEESRLDKILGIGKRRRQRLLSHFGSLERIKEASLEDLQKVAGISKELAKKIKSKLEVKE
ncbi:MAG: excinuclease ABC subunit C [Armatimonadetes bacterium CG07_land_8_20_14_0_80_40_9]|nr:MAG: excinuclease ABC subunit C [Armatimonadetes bacterium CG07_land_8_20_14_0_80_40_9]